MEWPGSGGHDRQSKASRIDASRDFSAQSISAASPRAVLRLAASEHGDHGHALHPYPSLQCGKSAVFHCHILEHEDKGMMNAITIFD
jgi:Multicopper oxidase